MHPRLRSVLYVPAANRRALEKARALPADGLILDLEDAVAPEAKPLARDAACDAVRAGGYATPSLAIRVNAIGTPWHDEDVAAAAAAEPDALVIPKVGAPADILEVERRLEQLGNRVTKVWAMLETPAAVLDCAAIAETGTRLRVLVIGTNDLLAELHAEERPDRGPLGLSLQLCLLAARAADRTILDGVYNDIQNGAGFEAECLAARRLGFDGKTLIHPSQIDPCNQVFSPSPAELDHARRVVAAYDGAARAGAAVATLDGRLIEQLHVRSAQRILANDPFAEGL